MGFAAFFSYLLGVTYSGVFSSPISSFMLLVCIFPCGVVGGRIQSILTEDGISNIASRPIKTIFRPGFSYHGSMVGILIGCLIFQNSDTGHSFFFLFDCILVIGITMNTFARLGCHNYGCCFGRLAADTQWAIVYRNPDSKCLITEPGLCGRRLIPAQLYGFVLYFTMLLVLWASVLLFDLREGTLGGLAFVLYFIMRMIHEHFRRECKKFFSASKIISFVLFLVGIGLLFWLQVYEFGRTQKKAVTSLPGVAVLLVSTFCQRWTICVSFFFAGFLAFGVHFDHVGRFAPMGPDSLRIREDGIQKMRSRMQFRHRRKWT